MSVSLIKTPYVATPVTDGPCHWCDLPARWAVSDRHGWTDLACPAHARHYWPQLIPGPSTFVPGEAVRHLGTGHTGTVTMVNTTALSYPLYLVRFDGDLYAYPFPATVLARPEGL